LAAAVSLQSRLTAAAKALILGRAAQIAVDAQDFGHAMAWARWAIERDPLAFDVARLDALVIRCLEGQGLLDEAAKALEGRLERFGPRSAWFKLHAAQAGPDFLGSLAADGARATQLRERIQRDKTSPSPVRLSRGEIHGLFRGRLLWVYSQCYGEALRSNPKLQGKIALDIQWGPEGSVRKVSARKDTVGHPPLVACLARRVASVQNAPKAAARIHLPLIFRPSY